MKGKRSKQYRKLMHTYALTFGLREPYQTMLTASFIRDAARHKMNLGNMLTNTLHGEIKPMITQCSIRHLYTAPTPTPEEGGAAAKEGWIEVAKQAERRRCGHHELEEPLGELECLQSVVDPKGAGRNRFGYVVAAQEKEIRARMRDVAGVPLVYINRSVMILEPMAMKSAEVREAEEKGKIRAGLKTRRGADSSGGEKRKREGDEEGVEGEAAAALKKRKSMGPKAPNPLSVKKAKKPVATPSTVAKEVEDERSVVRKAAKRDPQAGEKALSAELAVGEAGDVDGERKKRRRKRKGKEGESVGVVEAGDGDDST